MADQSDGVSFMAVWKVVQFLVIPLLGILYANQQSTIKELDNKVYQLQKESVTEAKLQAMEQRMITYTDVRLNDLSGKMEIIIKYLEMQRGMNTSK